MFLLNLAFAGICFVGVVTEFIMPEERSSQARLFVNAVFCGANLYFAWVQM